MTAAAARAEPVERKAPELTGEVTTAAKVRQLVPVYGGVETIVQTFRRRKTLFSEMIEASGENCKPVRTALLTFYQTIPVGIAAGMLLAKPYEALVYKAAEYLF